MNAPLATLDRLLAALLDLAHGHHTLPCQYFRATRSHLLKSVEVDTGLLVLPLQGRKRIRVGGGWTTVRPGQLLLVPAGSQLDVENIPDPASGDYVSVAIPLASNVLDSARSLLPELPAVRHEGVSCMPLEPLADGFAAWMDAMVAGRSLLACHAVAGVLLRLHELGHGGLLHPPPPTLASRIRGLVAADPAREWTSVAIESAFGVSGATLRRRLAAEGASLRGVLAGARLACSVPLLMSGQLPLKTVAARVGYASVASFVQRFTERYGVEPARLIATAR